MKNLFNKIILALASVAFLGLLTGCNPEIETKPFSVTFTGFGPGYVSCVATVPSPTQVFYLVSDEPIPYMEPEQLILDGFGAQTTFYTDGEQQLLDFPVEEEQHYYVYLTARLGNKLSKMYEYDFETGTFEFNQLATVVAVAPDGYKMFIKVPPSVKKSEEGQKGSRAIRYTQGDLMIYNFYKSRNDDYFNLLYNAGRYVTEDTMVEYSDALNEGEAGIDVNEDGVVDGNDISMLWNPIAPGEPVVFVAGEFEWMSEPDDYKKDGKYEDLVYTVNGFSFPGGWEDGYYLPCLDGERYWLLHGKDITGGDTASQPATRASGIITDVDLSSESDPYWTGAFQRKLFRTRMPAKLDAKIEVRVEDLMSVNATLTIIPDKKIYRYLYTVLDDGAYKQMLELLNGKEEYLQWAVTSYFTMYNFGQMQSVAGTGMTSAPAVKFSLAEYFWDVPADTKYHVLITGMSGEIGSPQCFVHHTFSTPAKTKTKGPTIVVTPYPEEECDPYIARFNVKCTSVKDNPAVRCYYGASYVTDWVYSVNSGSTYETLGQTVTFSPEDIDEINSPNGLEMAIPTIDHETTRLVVVAFNDENISNGINRARDPAAHPAVADCTTPYAEAKDRGYLPTRDDGILVGDWLLTATVKGGEVKTQRVHIRDEFVEGVDYPSTLPDDVLKVYQDSTEWTNVEIEGYFEEFKTLSEQYNEGRLKGQNKLLIEGWLDDSQGSLTYLSPWDLFKHKEISTVDVPSMFARFGPKIYLHVNKAKGSENFEKGADSLSVTANKMFVSPVADWSVPFYMAARATDNSTLFQYSDDRGNYLGAIEFPVTLSEDKKTITIHPLYREKTNWYPNVIGVSSVMGTVSYVLENPIESAVVLTKIEEDSQPETGDDQPAPLTRTFAGRKNVAPIGDPDLIRYYPMSDFKSVPVPVEVEGEVMTLEKVQANMDRFYEQRCKIAR